MIAVESASSDGYRDLLHKLLKVLETDLRIQVLIQLLSSDGPLSFRALGRRVRVNYRKLDEVLKQLVNLGIVEVYTVRVSQDKKYRFYSLNEQYARILKELL